MFGAGAVLDATKAQSKSDTFAVALVWIKVGPTDQQFSAASNAREMSDPRVKHFYDSQRSIGQQYSEVLWPGEEELAWDIYFVYEKGVTWTDAPPQPTKWVTQLGWLFYSDSAHFRQDEKLSIAIRENLESVLHQ